MRLRSLLFLGGILAVTAAVALGVVVYVVDRAVQADLARSVVTSEIRRANSQLVLVSHEYLTRGSERALTQWSSRHASQGDVLAELSSSSDRECAELVARTRESHQVLGGLFAEIVATRAARSAAPPEAAALAAREGLLESRLLVALNDMLVNSVLLDEHVQGELVREQERGTSAALWAVIILAVVLASIFWVVGRRVLKPLRALREGVAAVGAGDLSHRIGLEARDEVGELARAFDRMAGDLQSVTVSRDDLEEQLVWRSRVEQVLRDQATELARSNAELEEFAYVASHDLQEPLRMVVSYLQILERRYKGALDDDADEFIGYAVDGAQRMQAMIEDLLALSRVGTRGMDPEPVEAGQALAAALRNLRLKMEECAAEVIVEGELPTVMADPGQVAQLFQNLVSNSLKFRGADRPRIRVKAEREDGRWLFSVRDNGIGVDEQYAERIFGVFQRLHNREEYPGTGIGLSICRKIVERHGGRIWVEGRPGAGATFLFTLPALAAE